MSPLFAHVELSSFSMLLSKRISFNWISDIYRMGEDEEHSSSPKVVLSCFMNQLCRLCRKQLTMQMIDQSTHSDFCSFACWKIAFASAELTLFLGLATSAQANL